MRRLFILSLIMAFLFSFALPAFAEVTTFGFNDSRTRTTEGTAGVFWPAWKDDSGTSYSQPLILKGWGAYSGKIVVVSVNGNQVRGYVCVESVINSDGSDIFQQNNALWSIPLSGGSETKSHPTVVEKSGRKYIYIGTDLPGFIHIIDITDFNNAEEVKVIADYYSVDIVSAPLVLNWRGHEVVVYTVGNNPSVHLAIDPLELEEPNIIEIKVATSGRTSSTPGPVLGGQGFVVGLDRGGGSARGEIQVYKLDDVLAEDASGVYQQSSNAFYTDTTLSSVVASFSVDGNKIYFGDQYSRVYGYDLDSGVKWYNDENYGIFSNRSPALTANTVYFPATGNTGEAGKILSIDRSSSTNWATPFENRAQTAPIVWMDAAGGSAMVLVGTSGGDLALLDPYDSGRNYSNIHIASASGGSAYASGVSGELSAGENWLVGTTGSGVIAWQAIPMDLKVVSLDPGCPVEGGVYAAEAGTRYTATAVVRGDPMPWDSYLDIPLAAYNEIGGVAYPATLTDVTATELTRKVNYYNNYFTSMSRLDNERVVQFEWTATPGSQVLTMAINTEYPEGAAQLVNVFPETTFDNNIMQVPITSGGYDVKIKLSPLSEAFNSYNGRPSNIRYSLEVTRKDGIPGNIDVDVTVRGAHSVDNTITLAPGESHKFEYAFSAGAGTYTLQGEAWPIAVSDIYEPDNIDRLTIIVGAVEIPDLPTGDKDIRVGL